VLDDPLAPLAARQVEVDVRPFSALLGKKALEQQIHADGIDRGDAEHIADRAVRRRAAALNEDSFAPAELDDLPDDEEVSGETELRDDGELVIKLRV
jgi:hypothetical protein